MTGPVKPEKPRYVQIRNPRTGRYVKVDRARGVIVAHKRSPGPFARIVIVRVARPVTIEDGP